MIEVIPEAVLLIGCFFLLVTAMFLRGALAGYSYSFGSIFRWMHDHLRLPLPGFLGGHLDVGAPFGTIDKAIVGAFQTGINDTEKYLALCWHAAEKLVRLTAESIDWLARETSETFDWLIHTHLGKWAATFVTKGGFEGIVYKYIFDQLRRLWTPVSHAIAVAVEDTWKLRGKILHWAAAIDLLGPLAIPRVMREFQNLIHWRLHVEKRLSKLERVAGATAIAVAISNAWGIPLRCAKSGGPIARLARSMCGLPAHFLNDVFGLLADFFVLENICAVLPWVEDAGSAIGAPLIENLTDLGAGLCSPDSKRPGTLAIPQLYLSQTTDSLLAGV